MKNKESLNILKMSNEITKTGRNQNSRYSSPKFDSNTKKSPAFQNSSSRQGTPAKHSSAFKVHRRGNSQDVEFVSSFHSLPCKSRIDYTSVPEVTVDVRACYGDILKFNLECRRAELIEKRLMHDEWVEAKKKMKKEQEKLALEHEEFLTSSRLELNEWTKNSEKEKKNLEMMEKIQDFYAFKDAKNALKVKEIEENKKILKDEIEKTRNIRKLEIEKKEILKKEREERRKSFFENLEAKKISDLDEKKRDLKEAEFLHAQEVAGRRKMMSEAFERQKGSMEKVEMILNN
jgi:hypothetical protein